MNSVLTCLGSIVKNFKFYRGLQTSVSLQGNDKKWTYKSLTKPDEGTEGEGVINIDYMIEKKHSIFPDKTSHLRIFNGVPYEQLPICSIKVSPNNTIINIANNKGVSQFIRSCGIEGFKNTRKGTNIAAQATAITISSKAVERGIKDVRVKVHGLGPGRMAAIKGLQMGGLNIISITDATRVSWNPPRPRKARRL